MPPVALWEGLRDETSCARMPAHEMDSTGSRGPSQPEALFSHLQSNQTETGKSGRFKVFFKVTGTFVRSGCC